jgi:spectinomycin phosphotransferase
VLCHGDIHAGNVLIDAHERLSIVDWDNPILAPKERDLMYAGGAQFGQARTLEAEERLFYQGYGSTAVDARVLAYYRYERIIEDIAAYCNEVLLKEDGGADRMQAVQYVRSNFEPGGTLEAAHRGDRSG